MLQKFMPSYHLKAITKLQTLLLSWSFLFPTWSMIYQKLKESLIVEVKVGIKFHWTKWKLLKPRNLIDISGATAGAAVVALQVLVVSSNPVHFVLWHGEIVRSRSWRRYKRCRKIVNDTVVHHHRRRETAGVFDLDIWRWSEGKWRKWVVVWWIQAFCYDFQICLETQEFVLWLEVVDRFLILRQCRRRCLNLMGD